MFSLIGFHSRGSYLGTRSEGNLGFRVQHLRCPSYCARGATFASCKMHRHYTFIKPDALHPENLEQLSAKPLALNPNAQTLNPKP